MDSFNENGYLLVRGMFTPEEIMQFRKQVISFVNADKEQLYWSMNSGGITIPDFIKQESLASVGNIRNNGRLHTVLKTIFKGTDYRFCQHNDIGIDRLVGLHKDRLNGEYRKYETVDIWGVSDSGEKHEIFKVLVYLQDNDESNCLVVYPGSHKNRDHPDPRSSRPVKLKTKIGDVIVFDQRLSHCGITTKTSSINRILVSFGFGKNNIFTDNFEKGTILRQDKQVQIVRVAHIYAASGKKNSGDYAIGIATKHYFKEKYLSKQAKVVFTNLDCRVPGNLTVDRLNSFDYLVIGGGGLILPDTCPNKVSGWQLMIPESTIKLLRPELKVFVISIGYNLFYNQTMAMPDRFSNHVDSSSFELFKNNISTLIDRSDHFSLRHKQDLEELVSVLDINKDKLTYEQCPTVWYVNKYWRGHIKQQQSLSRYIAIEIKDDQEWRRYHKIGKNTYYNELLRYVTQLLSSGEDVAILSHDGSKNFWKFLVSKGIKLQLLDNSCANETKIIQNYAQIKLLLCSAGHSQMMAYGMGIPTISLITHPKLQNFCDETGTLKHSILVNDCPNICLKLIEITNSLIHK